MTVPTTIDASAWLRKHLEENDPDLLRAMLKAFAEALMSAEASMQRLARSPRRTSSSW